MAGSKNAVAVERLELRNVCFFGEKPIQKFECVKWWLSNEGYICTKVVRFQCIINRFDMGFGIDVNCGWFFSISRCFLGIFCWWCWCVISSIRWNWIWDLFVSKETTLRLFAGSQKMSSVGRRIPTRIRAKGVTYNLIQNLFRKDKYFCQSWNEKNRVLDCFTIFFTDMHFHCGIFERR